MELATVELLSLQVSLDLASSCIVVVKPSELTPLTTLAYAELSLQDGVPPVTLYSLP